MYNFSCLVHNHPQIWRKKLSHANVYAQFLETDTESEDKKPKVNRRSSVRSSRSGTVCGAKGCKKIAVYKSLPRPCLDTTCIHTFCETCTTEMFKPKGKLKRLPTNVLERAGICHRCGIVGEWVEIKKPTDHFLLPNQKEPLIGWHTVMNFVEPKLEHRIGIVKQTPITDKVLWMALVH